MYALRSFCSVPFSFSKARFACAPPQVTTKQRRSCGVYVSNGALSRESRNSGPYLERIDRHSDFAHFTLAIASSESDHLRGNVKRDREPVVRGREILKLALASSAVLNRPYCRMSIAAAIMLSKCPGEESRLGFRSCRNRSVCIGRIQIVRRSYLTTCQSACAVTLDGSILLSSSRRTRLNY